MRETISDPAGAGRPKRISSNALPTAPTDSAYGKQGTAAFLPHELENSGLCTQVLQSTLKQSRTYTLSTTVFGHALICALDDSGQLDPAFNGTGIIDLQAYLPADQLFNAFQIREDTGGHVLCLGILHEGVGVHLWRFDINGNLDQRFGSGGHADLYDLLGHAFYSEEFQCGDHGYTLLGFNAQHTPRDLLLVSLTAAGALHTEFGKHGTVNLSRTLPGALNNEQPKLAMLNPSRDVEKILVFSGRASPNEQGTHALLSCFNANGALDQSFAEEGHAFIDVRGATAISVNHQTRRITLGASTVALEPPRKPLLLQLEFSGKPAASFNAGKPVALEQASGQVAYWSHIAEADGLLLAYGLYLPFDYEWVVACYRADGSLDTRFNAPYGYGSIATRDDTSSGFRPYQRLGSAAISADRLLINGDDQKQNTSLLNMPALHAIALPNGSGALRKKPAHRG